MICSKGSDHYNTSSYIAKLLSPLEETGDSYIAHSKNFCEKLKQQQITSTINMVSFDVVDLFTNIPKRRSISAF